MKTPLYNLAAGLFVGIVVVVLAALLLGLRQALRRTAAAGTAPRRSLLAVVAFGLLMWLAFTAALAAASVLQNFDARPPRLLLLLPWPFVGATLLARSTAAGRWLDALPPAGPVYLQTMRVLVELVLWLLLLAGVAPRQMTLEGLNWDVLTGLSAPIVAYFCLVRRRWPWQLAVAWNVGGLLLLANIVTISLLSAPLPIRQFFNEPANTFVARWPFIWLPTFIVPVAYLLHLLSIRQLWRRAAAGKETKQASALE